MKKRKHFAFNIWFSNMKLLSLAVGILLVVLILSYTKENQRKEEERTVTDAKKYNYQYNKLDPVFGDDFPSNQQ